MKFYLILISFFPHHSPSLPQKPFFFGGSDFVLFASSSGLAGWCGGWLSAWESTASPSLSFLVIPALFLIAPPFCPSLLDLALRIFSLCYCCLLLYSSSCLAFLLSSSSRAFFFSSKVLINSLIFSLTAELALFLIAYTLSLSSYSLILFYLSISMISGNLVCSYSCLIEV